MLRLIPYFNSTLLPARPGDEWERPISTERAFSGAWDEGDRLVRSVLDYEASISAWPTITDELERIFGAMNADNRPNGRHERSLSVGDMIAVVVEGNPTPVGVWRIAGSGFQEQWPIPLSIINDLKKEETSLA